MSSQIILNTEFLYNISDKENFNNSNNNDEFTEFMSGILEKNKTKCIISAKMVKPPNKMFNRCLVIKYFCGKVKIIHSQSINFDCAYDNCHQCQRCK
jgi:hypothetical protein